MDDVEDKVDTESEVIFVTVEAEGGNTEVVKEAKEKVQT